MPRIAMKNLSLQALSIGLFASVMVPNVKAQIVEELNEVQGFQNQQITNNADTAVSGSLRSDTSGLQTQPVSISSGMAPNVAPAAPFASPNSFTIPSPSTGIGGNNPGNANTGGVQVQSVSVQAVQDSSTNNRADLIRRERLRRELENESRLIEKIEEGRLEDEAKRARTVDTFGSVSQMDTMQSVPVVAMTSASIVDGGYSASATSVSMNTSVRDNSGTSIRVTPFAGHRWYRNSNQSEFLADNLYVVGAGIEGTFNEYVGIEGTFAYGRDEFLNRFGAGYGNFWAGQPTFGRGNNGMGGLNYIRSRDTYEFTAALKATLPVDSVRPYGVAGMGWVYQDYNIDSGYTTSYANNIGWDRNTNHLMGVFGGGIDVSLGENFLIGTRFDYQAIVNRKYTEMHRIYNDATDRYRVTGNIQVKF